MKILNNVLLIDDDDLNNFINEKLLGLMQITKHISTATSGRQALVDIKEKCGKDSPDCPDLWQHYPQFLSHF